MIIGINASFLRKPHTGVGQVTVNFLRQLTKQASAQNRYILYLQEDIDWTLPDNFEKRIFLPPYHRDDLIRQSWWEKLCLPRHARKDGCEVFLSLYQSATIFNGNIRHVMLVHDAVWKIFPQYLGNLRKKIYYALVDKAISKADHIITVSENSKQDIEKHFSFPTDQITIAYDDCDPIFKQPIPESAVENTKKKYNLPGKYIFYIGGLDARKNVDRLLKAYSQVLKENPNAPTLVVVGKFHAHLVPLMTDLPQRIKEVLEFSGASKEKIRVIDFVPGEDLPAMYKGSQLFCYPSLYEGFGLPILEAYNTAALTLTSSAASLKELADETTAIIVDPESVTSIAQGIKKGLSDQTPKTALIEKAREKARQFSWEKFTKIVIDTIKK